MSLFKKCLKNIPIFHELFVCQFVYKIKIINMLKKDKDKKNS